MVRDGQLLLDRRGRYGPVQQMDLLRGRVSAHKDGYGFFIADGEHADLYLSPREMRAVMDGDRARGQRHRRRRPRSLRGQHRRGAGAPPPARGRPLPARRQAGLAGAGRPPPGRRDPGHGQRHRQEVRDGQIAVVEITHYADRQQPARGLLVELLGEHLAPGMEIDIALRKHDLPWQWPAEVEAQAAGFADPRDGRRQPRPRGFHAPAADHHRRRGRARLRRRRVRRARRPRLAAAGGDRRRQPLRAPGQRHRRRGAPARHVGVLPAARHPDAAGGAVERAVLAQARGRAPGAGVRDAHQRPWRGTANTASRAASSARMPAPRTRKSPPSLPATKPSGRATRRCCRRSKPCTACTRRWMASASGAARWSSNRPRRASCTARTARSTASSRSRATSPTA